MSDVAGVEVTPRKTKQVEEPLHILKPSDFQISDYAYADFSVTLPV